MPLDLPNDLPTKFPVPEFLTLDNWKRGVITLIDRSKLPKNALSKAQNIFLYEDGNPGPRPGVNWFGTSPMIGASPSSSLSPSSSRSPSSSLSPSASASGSPSSSASPSASNSPSSSISPSRSPSSSLSPSSSASGSPSSSNSPSASNSPSSSISPSPNNPLQIDGFDYFDFNGVIHLVVAAGGTIFRSTNDAATWTVCTGATIAPDVAVQMVQNGSYLYITNGLDNIIRYDGSTTLATYSALTTPAAPSVAETGLAGTGYTYYYKVARVNTVGFSIASAASTAVQSSVPRASWDNTTNFATLTTPNGVATQTRWDFYISENDIDYFYLSSATASNGAAASYKDNGTAIPNPVIIAPTGNTTQGPRVAELSNVGTRMYGVRDTDNEYRIWFSGAGQYAGAFSSAYDGGYIDWQEGGKYRPVKVEDYRDGKGTPLATVWCKSADGQGCVLQLSLDTLTIGDISITLPAIYKLPGSRGTGAPGSVVNVLNDYYFYNSQAIYNLGSRAQFLNLLSTDEASANIRPTVKQISVSAEEDIASAYNEGKVYFSVPLSSSTLNRTMIYDTELKAWLPEAFMMGFKKFLRYTDTSGNNRLLALKQGDMKLSEISSSIKGDYGVPFETVVTTGLYPVTKNRFEFQFTEEAQVELTQPVGSILVSLIGYTRQTGFGTIASKNITGLATSVSDAGWDSDSWDSELWDDTSEEITVTSEPSVKRYFTVQTETNALQWSITTSSLDSSYILRTLQTMGTATQAGPPRSWRIV